MTNGIGLYLESQVTKKYIFMLFKSLLFQSLPPQMTYSLIQKFSKYGPRIPGDREISETLSRRSQGQNYFHNSTETLFAFFNLILSQVCS